MKKAIFQILDTQKQALIEYFATKYGVLLVDLEAKEKVIHEKEQAIQELSNSLVEKEKVIQELDNYIKGNKK